MRNKFTYYSPKTDLRGTVVYIPPGAKRYVGAMCVRYYNPMLGIYQITKGSKPHLTSVHDIMKVIK